MSESLSRLVAATRSVPRSTATDALIASDEGLMSAARACRLELAAAIDAQLGPFDPIHLDAIVEVPRERFVRVEDLEHCCDDSPLPLDEHGLATISAPHAYLLSFRLLELQRGDSFLELGTGSGYGAALAARIVGPQGSVHTLEIDETLAETAGRKLFGLPNVRVSRADAMACTSLWEGIDKVCCTFAISELPPTWLSALNEGAVLVAPVGARGGDQRLVRVVRTHGELRASDHGAVRYVKNRSASA